MNTEHPIRTIKITIYRKTIDFTKTASPRVERWAFATPASHEGQKWLRRRGFTYDRRSGEYVKLLWQREKN